MRKTFFTLSSSFILLLLSVVITVAQGACAEFFERALEAVDSSCQGLGRNEACYGFNRVEASFQSDVDDDFFTEPADIADVTDLETIRTAPFNLNTDEWGVAVLVLQANMPETLPGQNVTFVLMGDSELENAVQPDDAHNPIEGIVVTVTFPQGAAVRSGPGDNFNTIGGVVTGTTFVTDGVSADGDWLRIVWEERPAWIRRTTVEQIAGIADLPVFNNELRTPMQAVYLRTGIGQPTCNEVPDNSLLVQGPEDIEIELTVNGANIELGSSGVIRILNPDSPDPEMELTVLDGQFVIKADEFNPRDVVVNAGEWTRMCLSDGNNEGVNGQPDDLLVTCAASPPERIDSAQFQSEFCGLESIPGSVLNYGLEICNFDTTPRTHSIQSGENLFRISQFYCIRLDELIAVNNITDPSQIFVGQILTLPGNACQGSGSTRPPAGIPPGFPEVTPEAGSPVASCVRLISPLGNVNSGDHSFSWTAYPVPGVIYYLAFYTFEGNRAEVFETRTTSYTVNLGQETSTGGEFSWQVDVTDASGNYLCSSQRSPTLVRLGDLDPAPPALSMTLSCSILLTGQGATVADLSWSNLPANDIITLAFDNGYNTVISFTYSGSSGGITRTVPGLYTLVSATTTSGDYVDAVC